MLVLEIIAAMGAILVRLTTEIELLIPESV